MSKYYMYRQVNVNNYEITNHRNYQPNVCASKNNLESAITGQFAKGACTLIKDTCVL